MSGVQVMDRYGGKHVLSPDRDLAYIFGDLVDAAIDRLDLREWESLELVRKQLAVSDDDLAAVVEAIAHFHNIDKDAPQPGTILEHLEASGWHATTPGAQVLMMAALGQVACSTAHAGRRAATLQMDDRVLETPGAGYPDLKAKAESVTAAMNLPRWLRTLSLFWRRLRSRPKQLRQANKPAG